MSSPRKHVEPKSTGAPMSSTATDTSEPTSEADADGSECEIDPSFVRGLQRQLEKEVYRNTQLTAQLKRQSKLNEQLQLQAEQEEEYLANKLMKRLTKLKREKEELARQVEMEEEMITNKLSKKLEKVKQEKVNLENLLEQEQEYIVNKLQKQLSAVLDEKRALETQLREGTSTILQTLQQHLEQWRERSSAPAAVETVLASALSPRQATAASSSMAWASDLDDTSDVQRTHLLVQHLAQEIDALGAQQHRYRHECKELHDQNEKLQEELARLQLDNSGLLHRIAREREIRETAQGEKARLEQELELDSERAFNSASSISNSPGLTASMAPLSPRMLMPGPLVGVEQWTPPLLSVPNMCLNSPKQRSPR